MREIFYDLLGLNKAIFILVNKYTNVSIIPYFLQTLSSLFFIGNFAIAYFIICIWIYFKIKKLDNRQEIFILYYYELIKIGSCYALLGLSYATMKFGINMPRPFCSLSPEEFSTIAYTESERCLSSFPSAHTALCVIVVYFLWPYMNRVGKILGILTILLVAISRISLAMHYPADIIYSLILICIIICVNNFICDKLKDVVIIPIGRILGKIILK